MINDSQIVTPQNYLKGLFNFSSVYNPPENNIEMEIENRKNFIVQKLLRKKFRKQKLHPNTVIDITKKVESSVDQNIPLHFVIPFGGYKHFWNPSHPEPDWAEFFTFHSLTEWLAPVLAVYQPGATIEFISEDLILPRMNNYPPATIEQYAKIFALLLETFQKNMPKNLHFRYWRLGDRYDKDKMIHEVEALLPASWDKWKTYTDEQKEVELKRSKRSVMWKGNEELTGLTEEEKEKRTIESRLLELAYYEVEARPEFLGNYFLADNHIPICFSFGLSPDNIDHWIVLGTTEGSVVDYWIGRGIVEDRGDRIIPRIVSKHQYEQIKPQLKTEKVDILSLKNFAEIETYPGVLDFKKM